MAYTVGELTEGFFATSVERDMANPIQLSDATVPRMASLQDHFLDLVLRLAVH